MTDAHAFLDDDDLEVIAGCLAATVNGPFFPEWEFHTLFGLVRSEVAEVAAAWPSLPRLTPDWCASPEAFQRKAVNNAVNNLLGYPHGHHAVSYTHLTLPTILRV